MAGLGQIQRVVITRGRTINMGNYQSEKVEVQMEVELEIGSSIEQGIADLITEVRGVLDDLCEDIKSGSSG